MKLSLCAKKNKNTVLLAFIGTPGLPNSTSEWTPGWMAWTPGWQTWTQDGKPTLKPWWTKWDHYSSKLTLTALLQDQHLTYKTVHKEWTWPFLNPQLHGSTKISATLPTHIHAELGLGYFLGFFLFCSAHCRILNAALFFCSAHCRKHQKTSSY